MKESILKKLDSGDLINQIHLKQNKLIELEPNRKYSLENKELKAYINYLYSIYKDNRIYKDSHRTFIENIKTNTVKNINRNIESITEETLFSIIYKIKNEDYENFTETETLVLLSLSNDALNFFIGDLKKIPRSLNKSEFEEELPNYIKSKWFNRRITNIYEVDPSSSPKFDNRKYKHVKRLAHGTTNYSILSILKEGFKRASELCGNDEHYTYSGSALGDGIYFARLDQIDKCLGYIDRNNHPYIIIADVYYNNTIETDYFKSKKLTGDNIIHGKNLGAYSRDELVALPNQIQIKYILELK